jgi:hypothetical protein
MTSYEVSLEPSIKVHGTQKTPFEIIFSVSRFQNDDIDGIHQLWISEQ